jgi:hypothetical protein
LNRPAEFWGILASQVREKVRLHLDT